MKDYNGSSCINFKEKETLSQSKDYKKTITICHHILKHNDFENIYNDELYGLHGLNITTNADQYFDRKFNHYLNY